MEEAIVIYRSKYGATKKYAEWIAEEIGCTIKKYSIWLLEELKKYRTIIYGGGFYAGEINGISLIRDNMEEIKGAHIIVFTVGLLDPNDKDHMEHMLDINFSEEERANIKFFHFQGALDAKKLSLPHKMVMSVIKREAFSEGGKIDFIDKSAIKPLIEYVKKECLC